MPKRIFCLTLQMKFAIIGYDNYRKKEAFTYSFAKFSQSPTPIVLSPMKKNGRVGQDIWKRRLLRFGFDVLKLRNFQMSVKNKATWMPRRCVIYIPQIPYSHWSIHTLMATIGIEVVLYISAWGLCVARFDRQGNAKASEREASDSAGLHAFLCLNRNKNKHYGYLKPDIQPT